MTETQDQNARQNQPAGNKAENSNITSMRDLLFILFRYKWVIVVTMLATFVSTLGYLWIKDDIYEISAKVLVKMGQENSPPPSVIGSTQSVVNQKLQDINSEIEIIKSRELIEKVVDTLGLDHPPAPPVPTQFFKRVKYEIKRLKKAVSTRLSTLQVWLGLKKELSPREAAIIEFIKGLNVQALMQSNVIEIKLRVGFKQDSSVILNTLLKFYIERHVNAYKNIGVSGFFEDKTQSFKKRLDSSEKALEKFKVKNNIVSIMDQKAQLLNRLMDNKAQIDKTRTAISEAGAKVREIEDRLKNEPARLVTEEVSKRNQSLDSLKDKIFELTLKREQLLVKYQSDSIPIVNIDEQLQKLRSMLEHEETSYQSSTTTDVNQIHTMLMKSRLENNMEVKSLKNKLRSLVKNQNRYAAELKKLEKKERTFNTLAREVKVNEEDYLFYQKKAEESAASDAMSRTGISNTSVIEPAIDPIIPLGMRKSYVMGIALSMGLVTAFCLVFLLELLDHSVNFPEQIEKRLGVETLATVRDKQAKSADLVYGVDPGVKEDCMQLLMVIGDRFKGVMPGSMAFVSAGSGEGTTTTALNVAFTAQEELGWKVLAVEMNQRSPSFSKVLGLQHAPGVSSVIAGERPQASSSVNFPADIMPFNATDKKFSNAQLKDAARRILDDMGKNYNLIIFDCAPMMRYGDFFAVSSEVESSVLVVESGVTRIEVLDRAMTRMERNHAELTGAVLNRRKHVIPEFIYRWI